MPSVLGGLVAITLGQSQRAISLFLVDSHFVVIAPLILNNSKLCSLLFDEVLIRGVPVVFLVHIHKPLGRK